MKKVVAALMLCVMALGVGCDYVVENEWMDPYIPGLNPYVHIAFPYDIKDVQEIEVEMSAVQLATTGRAWINWAADPSRNPWTSVFPGSGPARMFPFASQQSQTNAGGVALGAQVSGGLSAPVMQNFLTWPYQTNAVLRTSHGWRAGSDGTVSFHDGIVVSAGAGTPIIASADGKVLRVWENDEALGNAVAISYNAPAGDSNLADEVRGWKQFVMVLGWVDGSGNQTPGFPFTYAGKTLTLTHELLRNYQHHGPTDGGAWVGPQGSWTGTNDGRNYDTRRLRAVFADPLIWEHYWVGTQIGFDSWLRDAWRVFMNYNSVKTNENYKNITDPRFWVLLWNRLNTTGAGGWGRLADPNVFLIYGGSNYNWESVARHIMDRFNHSYESLFNGISGMGLPAAWPGEVGSDIWFDHFKEDLYASYLFTEASQGNVKPYVHLDSWRMNIGQQSLTQSNLGLVLESIAERIGGGGPSSPNRVIVYSGLQSIGSLMPNGQILAGQTLGNEGSDGLRIMAYEGESINNSHKRDPLTFAFGTNNHISFKNRYSTLDLTADPVSSQAQSGSAIGDARFREDLDAGFASVARWD